jgi:hypothetical protein
MGLGYKLADTTNATYSGGIDVPLDDFSDANIRRLFLTTKRFPKINIKTCFRPIAFFARLAQTAN